MRLDLRHLIVGEARSLIQDSPARFQLADIVQQRRGSHVFDLVFRQAHLVGNLRSIDGYPVRMILRELVVANELIQDLQHAVVGLPQVAQPALTEFVEGAGGVSRNQQEAGPDGEVGPGQQAAVLQLQAAAQGRGIHHVHPDDEENRGHSRLHGTATAEVVRGQKSREIVEGQHQPLAFYEEIDQPGQGDDRENEEKLSVHVGQTQNPLAFHDVLPLRKGCLSR